ncbi:hypothetical protein RRF57_002235 [Xylaria bambusicola]|uniref:Dienelactone hydrolase domain-containing protein n=1 Tax=Xylaria bambusicola TaxID=326684 RepID=A0AAN7U618_9PEZI
MSEPTGADIKVGKHDAYLATPDPAKAHKDIAILYLPDVIGLWQNSKLMADQFAANGYLTLIIDLFNGDPVSLNPPAGFEIFKWLENGSDGKTPHTKEHVDPIVVEAIKWLQTEKGIKKLGSVGYCFGAKYVARHFDNGINVGYMAHPSFVDEDELRGFKGPLSIAAAETDQIFPPRSATAARRFLRKSASLTRSTCIRVSYMVSPCALISLRRTRNSPRNRPFTRLSNGSTTSSYDRTMRLPSEIDYEMKHMSSGLWRSSDAGKRRLIATTRDRGVD